jgi:carbonic anhydrase
MSARRVLRVPFLFGASVFAIGLSGSAAANWQTVYSGKAEVVQIDKSRMTRAEDDATAWSRVMLGREVKDGAGAYNSIQVQNLYDCTARRFTIMRRAYFNDEALVREDTIIRPRSNAVEVGSLDERAFDVACHSAPGDQRLAGKPPITAQLKAFIMRVADTSAAPEKSRLIVLPPIDKAAADQAAASVAAKNPSALPATSVVKPEEKPPVSVAKETGGAKAGPPGNASAPPKPGPAMKKAPAPEASASPDTAAERRLRELYYATSGPRKAARKKPPLAPMADDKPNPVEQLPAHWSYDEEGGPANWAKLRKDYAVCGTGKRQSPIDIREGIKVDLEAIRFDYKPSRFRIVDNSHTIQVAIGEGMGLTITGKRYELVQFHFHKPSEERINGRAYDMVVHLVHRNDEGKLAVVAILLEKGAEHPLIQTLWNNLPLDRGMEVAPEDVIDLNALLPERRAYWTYMGSLTTPPCTEGVTWMVLKQPMQVSPEQVAIFSRLYRNNARPLQPANDRLVKESR